MPRPALRGPGHPRVRPVRPARQPLGTGRDIRTATPISRDQPTGPWSQGIPGDRPSGVLVIDEGRRRQTICSERIELPNHVPSTPDVAVRPVVVLAPMVSSSGTKCSGVAWATSTPGPLRR